MTYATAADLETRYGLDELIQLTDRAGTHTVDHVVVGKALADADSIIDGYIGAAIALPLASVPARLTAAACAIARYLLWQDGHPERVRLDYEDVLVWLRDVAAGRASLGLATSAAPPVATALPAAVAPQRLVVAPPW